MEVGRALKPELDASGGGRGPQATSKREGEGASSSFKPKLSRLKADYAEKRVDGRWGGGMVVGHGGEGKEKRKGGKRRNGGTAKRWRKNASQQKRS